MLVAITLVVHGFGMLLVQEIMFCKCSVSIRDGRNGSTSSLPRRPHPSDGLG